MREVATTEVPRDLIGGRYRVLAFRGAGSEGSVYLAVDLFTGEQVALKLGAVERLASEYAKLAVLEHPNLSRARALWQHGGEAVMALEYCAEDLGALRGAPEALVVRHVGEIARALSYLHRRGVIHADVKPQNALVAGPAGARRALLIDLGLAGVERTSRGSLEYAAPEVLEGGAPSTATDLYSLGVTLHELLSGVNPFAAPTPAQVIRAHFGPIPKVRASPGVQAAVAKLLARDPGSRYATADEVVEALSAATGIVLHAEGEGLAPDCIRLGSLHGREPELARFAALVPRVRGGSGAQLLLTGPSGSGRSRLLGRFKVDAELGGLRVLHLPSGEGLQRLCSWLGVLLEAQGPIEPSPEMAQKLLAGACEQHPLALLLDDVDADPGLRALLAALARSPEWKERPLLVAAAARGAVDPALERIDLPPLAPPVARAKLLEALGPGPWTEGLAELVVRETSGRPGELEDALYDLAGRGILSRQRGRWELDEARAGRDFSGCVPRFAERAARAHVSVLEPGLQAALGVAAVLGIEFDRASLAILAGEETVEALIRSGLLASEGATLRFPRLALARAAERALPAVQRSEASRRAAALTTDPALRAAYLMRAGSRGGVRAAVAAARIRLRAGSPSEAARLYQVARAALRAPRFHPRAALLCERAADCLALAGNPAAARLEYAQGLARGGAAGRIWQKIAKARWQEGKFDHVLSALSQARAAGGDPLDIAAVEARAQAMRGEYERAEQIAMEALPLARSRADADAATRLHHLLGTCAWHRGDGRRAVAEERAAVSIARRLGDRRAEGDARNGLGTAYQLLGRYGRAAVEATRAIEIYAAVGDERQEKGAWNNLGVARYLAGEWDRALEAWEKVGASNTQTLEQELLTLNNLGYLHRERGDLPRARDCFRKALTKIRDSGGYARLEATVCGNLGEVAAREGDLAAAQTLYDETLEIARRIEARDEILETERRLAELDLQRRNPTAANARAAATLERAVQAGNHVERGNLLRIMALAARARGDAAAADSAVREAREALQQAGAALELARLDCVAGLLELDRGDAARAGGSLRRARGVFERLGAAPDLREVEQLQADIETLHRKSLSQVEALTHAAQRLAAPRDTAALLEEVLDQALQLTGAERGFILLHESGGPPRVVAVRGADANATLHISRTVADRVLRSGEVIAVADIVGRDQLSTQKSILDLGLRSVLCAPIRSSGSQLGILYLDSRRVGAILSEKDLGLLSAFASLAGSALENVRLIDDLRRKSELLAHMAHEFRSPLVGIKGYADLVCDDPALSRQARADLDVISSEAIRLSNLVNRTLDLARMEAGATKMPSVRVSVPEVAAAAIAGLKPLALMKSIAVDLSAEEGALPVIGDFERFVQVVTNLVGNAIHYSGNGTRVAVRIGRGESLPAPPAPRIEVEGAPSGADPAGGRPSTRITVADEGPGISAADLKQLFTPFFRAGKAATKGTGLGLVITREIVRQHGGEIRVESEPGRGTTFTVLLPGTV
jgi:signal transduction histidine kinase/tetratricopeptide (TPR) repeat protein